MIMMPIFLVIGAVNMASSRRLHADEQHKQKQLKCWNEFIQPICDVYYITY